MKKVVVGKVVPVCVVLLLLLVLVPQVTLAASQSKSILTVATEFFSDYGVQRDSYIAFKNYPNAGGSNVNGGLGWGSKWSPNKKDFTANFTDDYIPALAYWNAFKQPVAYSYSNHQMYRQLAAPISMDKDGKVYIQYDIMSQYVGRNGMTFNDIFVGNYYREDWGNICVGINKGNQKIRGKDLSIGNSEWYTYKVEFDIRARGEDTIRVKAFKRGTPEPADWDLEYDTEFGTSNSFTYVGFEIQFASYFGNLSVSRELEDNVTTGPSSMITKAREDFESYTINGEFAKNVLLKNYPTDNESNVNGGTGWKGKWSPSYTDFEAKFGDNVPMFADFFNNSLYTYGVNRFYRQLADPIYLLTDSEIEFRFDLVTQGLADYLYVNMNMLNDKLKVGLVPDAGGTKNLIAITVDGSTVTGKAVPYGNTGYSYIVRIHTSPFGISTVRMKVFEKGTPEPEGWDLERECLLGGGPITYLGFAGNTNSGGTYWDNIEVLQSKISSRVGSSGYTANVYLGFPNPVSLTNLSQQTISVADADQITITPVMQNETHAYGAIVSVVPSAEMGETMTMTVNIPEIDMSPVILEFTKPALDAGAEVENINVTKSETSVTATLTVSGKNLAMGNELTVLMAVYGANNELLGVDSYVKTQLSEQIELSVTSINMDKYKKVKIFCWDNLTNIIPLMDTAYEQ